jgi:hypothetical protein
VRTYLKKPFPKIGIVDWLKVRALGSSPSTVKKTPKPTNFVQRAIYKFLRANGRKTLGSLCRRGKGAWQF